MNLRAKHYSSDRPSLRLFSPSVTEDMEEVRTELADRPDAIAVTSRGSEQANGRAAMIDTPLSSIFGRLVKRMLDITLSLPVVIFILPPVAVVVKIMQLMQSPGPLFFCQERCGLHEKPFTIVKFRTMNTSNCHYGDRNGNTDDRIFPLGRILRRTKLDETPQFINVLLGSMSIVGPRPHHFEDVRNFSEVVTDYGIRTVTKPGITGLAQYTEYRGDFEWNCTESRVQKDLEYIESWSVGFDFLLIARTASLLIGRSVSGILRRTLGLERAALESELRVAEVAEVSPVDGEQQEQRRRAA